MQQLTGFYDANAETPKFELMDKEGVNYEDQFLSLRKTKLRALGHVD